MDQTKGVTPAPEARTHPALLARRGTVAALAAAAVGSVTFPISRLVGSRGACLSAEASEQAFARGLDLQKQLKYDEAVREFTKVICSQPDSSDPYLFRGMALVNGRRFKDSVADFSRVLELRPKDGRIYLYRGRSYLAMGDKARAVRDFRRALDLPTDDERLAVTARIQLQIAEGAR